MHPLFGENGAVDRINTATGNRLAPHTFTERNTYDVETEIVA